MAFTNHVTAFTTLRRCLVLSRHREDVVVHINRHIFFLKASKFEGHVDIIRVLVVMDVHPVCNGEIVYGVVELWYSPRPEGVSVLDSEQGSRVESIVKEAVKGTEAAAGIVEEVRRERHLVNDVVVEVVSVRVLCVQRVSWFVSALASCAGYLYLCYAFESSLGGSSSFLASRMVFPLLDVEMAGTFWNTSGPAS
jgi:hypothetical protein